MFIYLGKRGYYSDREYVFDMIRNKSTLRQLVKSSDKPEKIFHGLKEMGIIHLLINYDIFDRWVRANFSKKDQKLLGQFFEKYVKLIFIQFGYGVSSLKDLNEALWLNLMLTSAKRP